MGTVRYNTQRSAWMIDYVAATGARVRQIIGSGEEGRRLAKQVLRAREAEAALGIHRLPAARTPTFAEIAAEWLERMRPPRVRPKTWESYEDAVERLLPYFGDRRIGAITREAVDVYLVSGQRARPHHPNQRKKPQPLSTTTLNYTLHVLRFILNDAVDRGRLQVNPASKTKPLPKPSRPEDHPLQFLTPPQMDALLAVAEDPFRTMYRLAIDAGLRRGEALALKWRNLDLPNRRLYVRESRVREREGGHYVVRDGPPKTASSMTVIDDLSPSVIQALLALPAGDDPKCDYVFRNRNGDPFDPDNLDRVFRRHLQQSGTPPMGFHALRHTCVTLLIAAGEHIKAVQARMRHASIQTTLDTYGHLLPGAFQGLGARMEAWMKEQQERVQANNMTAKEAAAKRSV